MKNPLAIIPEIKAREIPTGSLSRRKFIYTASLATLSATMVGPYLVRAQAGNKINIATIGAGGKGASDTDSVAGENIVALCDADERQAAGQRKRYPNAKFYKDFRQMLESEKSIDAVIVATPDHLHAPASIMAMKMGKHVYCQKPLVHSVYEARMMRRIAQERKVATQMGNQGSAESGLRRAVEVIQAGVIGPVRQLHVWSNRPIWPQGMDRPKDTMPVPKELDWDLWLGPAPVRPYHECYCPFRWRGWQDFGTGALGDMACHTVNMPFRALKLGYPIGVEAESSGMNKETYPVKSKIKFEFPAREGMAPLTFWWYDGGNPKPDNPYEHDGNNKPPKDVMAEVIGLFGEQIPGSGCLIIGDKGVIFSPDDYGAQFFIKIGDDKELMAAARRIKEGDKTVIVEHEAIKAIPQTIPRSPGHYREWLDAIRGGPPAYSNFDIAAYLTEIILLGCVALRVGKKLEWDGPNMRATNAPEAAQYVRRRYRKGWTL
jgi:predicted dehydrogenase